MSRGQLSRREFLIIGGTVAAGALAGGGVAAVPAAALAPQGAATPRMIFKLSLRGRRGSIAGKLHNANLLFATSAAAGANRAHPGDNSRIVQIVVSEDEFDRLFTSRNSEIADLRTLGGSARVGDCNRDGRVTVDELVRGVRISLGTTPLSECTPFDRIQNGQVTVDELVRGVRNALNSSA